MVFKFRVLSSEDKEFIREYEILDSSTFLDFHYFIQQDLEYDAKQLSSFFLADKEWNKGLELTLMDMGNEEGSPTIPMESVTLEDILKQKKERLLYVFDLFGDRCFFIELVDIYEPMANVGYPMCSLSVGISPEQIAIDSLEIDDSLDMDEFDEYDEITNDIGYMEDFDVDFDSYDESDF